MVKHCFVKCGTAVKVYEHENKTNFEESQIENKVIHINNTAFMPQILSLLNKHFHLLSCLKSYKFVIMKIIQVLTE